MPDSQENNWERLGFTSEAQFIRSNEEWDEIVEHFRQAVNSYRTMYLAVEQTSETLQSFADTLGSPVEDMAIDIRHSEYPGRDSYGTYWYDPSGFHSDEPHVCFICGRPTGRIDIDFHGAFCNSEECNEVIRLDLERANGGPEERE